MRKLANIIQSFILASLSFLVTTVIIEGIDDYKFNKEWNCRMNEMMKKGVSPITRGGYVKYPVDTTKIDTIKSK